MRGCVFCLQCVCSSCRSCHLFALVQVLLRPKPGSLAMKFLLPEDSKFPAGRSQSAGYPVCRLWFHSVGRSQTHGQARVPTLLQQMF